VELVNSSGSSRRGAFMARIGTRDTQPELLVRRALRKLGLRYRLNVADLPGTPDLVLTKPRVAIFVHGCFWHGHTCKKGARPKTNQQFWAEKLDGNIARDRKVRRELRRAGWRVLTVWECQIRPGHLPRSLLHLRKL
jgi:DNA mismatch endonuclease (patch repair protein)